MKKLIMICLVLVMVLTAAVTPQGTYADDGEDYQPSDWQEWLSEDEWKHVSPEIQDNIRSQMSQLDSVARNIYNSSYDMQKENLDYQALPDFKNIADWADRFSNPPSSSVWQPGTPRYPHPELKHAAERCSAWADALEKEAKKEKPNPALIARYRAATNRYIGDIGFAIFDVESAIKRELRLYVGGQKRGYSDEEQGSDTAGDKGGGADSTDGEKSLQDILDDFMAEVGGGKKGAEDEDEDGDGEEEGGNFLIEQILQLVDIFVEEEGQRIAEGDKKGDEEDKKGEEDKDGGVQEEDAVGPTRCQDCLVLAAYNAEWQKTAEKASTPASRQAFILLVEKGDWRNTLEFRGEQPLKIQGETKVIAEGVETCEVLFADDSYGRIETVTAIREYSVSQTGGKIIHHSIYGRDLPLVNKGEESADLRAFLELAGTEGAGPIYVYGGSCLFIEDIKHRYATSFLVNWNCNREDADFVVIFGNDLQALWDRGIQAKQQE